MENLSVTQIVKKVLPAVVIITASKNLGEELLFRPQKRKKIPVSGGSGFIIGPSGLILTNRHVVAVPKAEYTIVLNPAEKEKKYKAKILAKDPINDVAVLKIQEKNLPFIELGDSSNLELGQSVIAIGNTLGMFRNTVSTGVVSGLSRYITAFNALDNKAQRLRGLIQTDAAINPGNSGGPLIDMQGKAIGINAAMILGAENIGFTLPINTAKNDLEDIKKYGRIRQPFLGVRYVLLNKILQNKYNFPVDYGAFVISEDTFGGTAIVPGSPADKAGIKESDIILSAQNEKISFENSLEDILQKSKVGQIVNFEILRHGRKIVCKTKIGEKIN